jgi:hypothetical protein
MIFLAARFGNVCGATALATRAAAIEPDISFAYHNREKTLDTSEPFDLAFVALSSPLKLINTVEPGVRVPLRAGFFDPQGSRGLTRVLFHLYTPP